MCRIRRKGATKGIEGQVAQVHGVDGLEVGCRLLGIVAKGRVAVWVEISAPGLDAQWVERAAPHRVLWEIMIVGDGRLGGESCRASILGRHVRLGGLLRLGYQGNVRVQRLERMAAAETAEVETAMCQKGKCTLNSRQG